MLDPDTGKHGTPHFVLFACTISFARLTCRSVHRLVNTLFITFPNRIGKESLLNLFEDMAAKRLDNVTADIRYLFAEGDILNFLFKNFS